MSQQSRGEGNSPREILAAYLEGLGPAGELDVDELCSRHARHADELRRMIAHWGAVLGALDSASFGERLERQHGKRVPTLSLDARPETDEAAAFNPVLERLQHRIGRESRYQILGEFARGGMGAILNVWDRDLRRRLAMKVVLGKGDEDEGSTPAVDERTLGRFLEEAQVTGQLEHPGIVPVYELGMDSGGQVFFTMRLVKGRDLKAIFELVREGAEGWTQTRALHVLLRICEAMSYAHSKGVVHRDLKPSNVMIGRYGEVYVMDWGLARVEGVEDTHDLRLRPTDGFSASEVRTDRKEAKDSALDSPILTMDGDVVGTPYYMPPEQALGRLDQIGPHSDVYAVGAMLYELLSGRMPYHVPGSRPSPHTILAMVVQGPPAPLHEIEKGIPAELLAICEKAMAREPAERYADMGELAEDLTAYVEGRVVAAHRTGAVEEIKKWTQRNKGLAAASAAAALLLIAGTITSLRFGLGEAAQRRLAEDRRDEVLKLSALQDVEDLLGDVDALWPPHPEHIAAYERWIADARALVAALPEHVADRDGLRARALPRSDEERRAQREAHADHAELTELEARIAHIEGVLAQRRDGRPIAAAEPDWSAFPRNASVLRGLAWNRIEPGRARLGDEALGLALAERAVELAAEDERAAALETLAWAHFAVGRDDEALDTGFAALEAATSGQEARFEAALARLEQEVAAADSEEWVRAMDAELERCRARRAELLPAIEERTGWRFPLEASQTRWWHNQLSALTERLEELREGPLNEQSLWSMPRRLAFARRLRDEGRAGGEIARRWEEAAPGLRAAYPELDLAPQLGLVPLGPDPDSGLWEFAHLMSGAEPERDDDGRIVFTEETGIVLVLLPGATFHMGGQAYDPTAPNYDPGAQRLEGPVHEVTLLPFFVSKYEVSQAQWMRLFGDNPSFSEDGVPITSRHPVDRVSWYECTEAVRRLGLALPTEQQWEYAARGGTSTVYWTGDDPATLEGATNILDAGRKTPLLEDAPFAAGVPWSDGFEYTAPVGSFAANPFGLHDVHGNVTEWCSDTPWYYPGQRAGISRDRSGARFVRTGRGGNFKTIPLQSRSAFRLNAAPSMRDHRVGLRPARAIR